MIIFCFPMNPPLKSSQDAASPIIQSLKEWNITFNFDLINEATTSFELSFPHNKNILEVRQKSFIAHNAKNLEWNGTIYNEDGDEFG